MERRLFYTTVFVFGVWTPRLDLSTVLWTATVFLLLVTWRRPLRTPWIVALSLTVFCLGLGRTALDHRWEPPTPKFGKMEVRGTILEPPRRWGKASVFLFGVDRIDGEAVSTPLKLLVQWSGCEQRLEVGDRWLLHGRVSSPEEPAYPGAFDQGEWLWSQRAQAVMRLHPHSSYHYIGPPNGFSLHQLSYRARAWMMRRLQKLEHEQARALVAGVVFGETQSLPRELQEQFRRTGTSHLLAASGMNVALLAGLIFWIGAKLGFGAWRVAPAAIPAVIAYAFLAGCSPSISRAATGAVFALTALWLGRQSDAWNTLCLSVWAILLWDPRQLQDLGFQLSVLAVIGLIAGPRASEKLGSVGQGAVLTLSASLVTLPIFWWSFGELSATLLPANLLLGPVVELLFPLGLVLTLFPCRPLLWLTDLLARLSLWLVKHLSTLADPILLVRPGPVEALLVGLAWYCWVKPRRWWVKLCALGLVGSALCFNHARGTAPTCERGVVLVRVVGSEKPYYWVSSHQREVLLFSEPWQEKRARALMKQQGCLRSPEVRELTEGGFHLRWGRFDWSAVGRYLPKSRFTVVRITQGGYSFQTAENGASTAKSEG